MRFSKAFLTKPGSILASLLVGFIILFSSISCAGQPADSLKKDSPKYLSFYENVDGETIHWEANFLGDEITSIYKNGKRIPDDLVNDYKDKIYDQLDEMRYGSDRFSFKMPDIHIDMEDLNKQMEKFKEEFPNDKKQFKFYQFDDENFKKEMEELQKKLRDLKTEDFKLKFDDKKFKEKMEKLEKDLQEKLRGLENYKFRFEWKEDEASGEV
jgi:chromosome segregation ATPase